MHKLSSIFTAPTLVLEEGNFLEIHLFSFFNSYTRLHKCCPHFAAGDAGEVLPQLLWNDDANYVCLTFFGVYKEKSLKQLKLLLRTHHAAYV